MLCMSNWIVLNIAYIKHFVPRSTFSGHVFGELMWSLDSIDLADGRKLILSYQCSWHFVFNYFAMKRMHFVQCSHTVKTGHVCRLLYCLCLCVCACDFIVVTVLWSDIVWPDKSMPPNFSHNCIEYWPILKTCSSIYCAVNLQLTAP